MTAALTWNAPGGSNSLNQTIRYRKIGTSTWTNFATLGPTANTSTITGLDDLYIYEFQVVNNCTVGGPSQGISDFKIKILCPTVTFTNTFNSITYSFSHLGGDVSKYVIDLMDSSGSSIIATQVKTSPSGTITDLFAGLTGSTNYAVRITVYAGSTYTFTKVCPNTIVTTAATPTCDAPTAVVATIS